MPTWRAARLDPPEKTNAVYERLDRGTAPVAEWSRTGASAPIELIRDLRST
jgi:hypothetical protein